MPLANPSLQYRATAVKTADGADLVVMCYEALVRWLGRAKVALEGGQIVECHQALMAAQELVANLSLSLDFSRAPEIAQGLRSIYDYINDQLVWANLRKDAALIEEVTGLVQPLLDAWRLAVAQTKRAARAAQVGSLPA
jgi:flagellar protein FliS